jgi:hypothetical protein
MAAVSVVDEADTLALVALAGAGHVDLASASERISSGSSLSFEKSELLSSFLESSCILSS